MGHINMGTIFYCIGNSQWCIYNTQSRYDGLINTQSRVLQDDWLILKNKATLNINMPYCNTLIRLWWGGTIPYSQTSLTTTVQICVRPPLLCWWRSRCGIGWLILTPHVYLLWYNFLLPLLLPLLLGCLWDDHPTPLISSLLQCHTLHTEFSLAFKFSFFTYAKFAKFKSRQSLDFLKPSSSHKWIKKSSFTNNVIHAFNSMNWTMPGCPIKLYKYFFWVDFRGVIDWFFGQGSNSSSLKIIANLFLYVPY